MDLNLENLSVEDLKTLRTNINLLLKDKCKPKYKENTCFINPDDLCFLRICYLCDNTYYRINITNPKRENYIRNVDESFLNKCLIISEEIYNSLISNIYEIDNKVNNFRNKQIDDLLNYRESLNKEFKEELQEIIKKYKDD